MSEVKHTAKPSTFDELGEWKFACDSYGKVRHSRKACVYRTVKTPGGGMLETIAGRIENWEFARLIAAAPDLLAALQEARAGLLWYRYRNPQQVDGSDDEAMSRIDAAIAKAVSQS